MNQDELSTENQKNATTSLYQSGKKWTSPVTVRLMRCGEILKLTCFYMIALTKRCVRYKWQNKASTKTNSYVFPPFFQNMVPNRRPTKLVMIMRVVLYPGFLQNDQYCFQKLAMHCVVKFWEYFVGNERSFVPGAGMLSSFIRSWFFLCCSA